MKYNQKFTLKTGEELTLRTISTKEAEKLAEYDNILFAQTGNFTRGAEDGKVTKESCLKYTQQQNEKRNAFLVAILNKQIIGHVCLKIKSNKKRMMHRCELGVGVLKDHWHKGIATILLEQIIDLAKGFGYEQMELDVVKGNKRAIKLYKKFGFKKQGETINSFKYQDGSYQNGIFMMKMLNK